VPGAERVIAVSRKSSIAIRSERAIAMRELDLIPPMCRLEARIPWRLPALHPPEERRHRQVESLKLTSCSLPGYYKVLMMS
jgi:hypothetical protein